MPLGANIDGLADYSFTLPFVDVTKQMRNWGSAESPWDGNCSVGPDNWPSQSNFGNVFVTLPGGAPSPNHSWPSTEGLWLISYTGNANIELNGIMRGSTLSDVVYNSATDTTTANLNIPTPTNISCNCIMLSFRNASTRAGGPGLKDLRILQPGYTAAQALDFSTPLLNLLSRFDVLRFMDWAKTNGNLRTSWDTRTLPSSPSFASDGKEVPWELIFSLANMLQIDPWINVPAHADDEYVQQLATLAHSLLSPNLNLYLEWSNEVWNWSFEQSHYAYSAANASVYAGDPYHLNATGLDAPGNPGYWHARYYVAVSLLHAGIFSGVFGKDSVGKDKRVRPVYAWQCGGFHEEGLAYAMRFWGEPSSLFHSIACAPYMTIGEAAKDPSLEPQDVLAGWRSFQQNISLSGRGFAQENFVASMAATAAYYGVYFQSYESGPDTAQGINSGGPLWAKANASVDPGIESIVFDYLQSWHDLGGSIMGPQNYFTLGAGPLDDPYGIYAVLQDMEYPTTPKLRAIDRAMSTPSVVSSVIPQIPALLNASFMVGHKTPASPNGFDGWPEPL